MNKKEILEIRRQLISGNSNITSICGCYVSEKGEVISSFKQSVATMAQEVLEKYLVLFKKTLSGTIAKNLIDITFSTNQVVSSEEHKLLLELRNTELKDESVVQKFYERAIQNIAIESNYLILLAHNAYDVPYSSSSGIKLEDGSSSMFSYIMCSICPVKLSKSALSYSASGNEFLTQSPSWVVAAPELGFTFPSFDDRSSNIYNALYYTHDTKLHHTNFIDSIFNAEVPLPAAIQKQVFQSILSESLSDACSYSVIRTVHEQLSERIDAYKVNNETEPLVISKYEIKDYLQSCDVDDEHVQTFEETFDTKFGVDAYINPINIIDEKRFELRTPNIVITVDPEFSHLIETGLIKSKKYILISSDEDIEVNGVSITISEDEE